VFGICLAGCSQPLSEEPDTASPAPVDEEMTRRDYLALTRLTETHTTDVETLEKIANSVIQASKEGVGARSVGTSRTITKVQKVTNIPAKSFTSGGGAARSAIAESEEPVEFYTFEVTDPNEEVPGYILASNDDRIGNILAIVDNGVFDDSDDPFTEILHKNLENYIDTTIAAYATLTDVDTFAALEKLNAQEEESRALSSHWEVIQNYLKRGYVLSTDNSTSDFKIVKHPLITTKWHQKAPYNNYVNYGLYKTGRQERSYVVGCVPLALGQLATYHQYMKSISPSIAVFNQPTINGWNPKIGVWTGQYNWAAMKNVGTLFESNTAMVGQIGVLLYQIGRNLNATYTPGTSMNNLGSTGVSGSLTANGSFTSKYIINTLKAMGYNTGNGFQYSTFEEKSSSGSIIHNYLPQSTKKNTLNNGYPYLVLGNSRAGAHAWLIDGYGTMTKYSEELKHPTTLDSKTVTVPLTNALMVHCNMGHTTGNGWYVDGIFDVGNMATNLSGSVIDPDSDPEFSQSEFSQNISWIAPTPIR
jgi:hypothetical protein